MSEMVERVARAIYSGAYPKFQFEHDAQHIRDHYREVARATIAAMREPTEAMLSAGSGSGVYFVGDYGEYNKYPDHDYIKEIWRGMIDDSLQEPPA